MTKKLNQQFQEEEDTQCREEEDRQELELQIKLRFNCHGLRPEEKRKKDRSKEKTGESKEDRIDD